MNYLREFEEKEHITLDHNNMKANPGLRSIAKLMLNTLYGKFGQRPDMPTTKIARDYQEAWDIYNNPDLKVLGDVLVEDMLLISYKNINIETSKPGITSVAIAAFVTAYARLHLYDVLEKLEESNPKCVDYFDTDSVVFNYIPGCYKPEIGHFLGEMTDEIAEQFGLDASIEEFYSLGPKTYAYRVSTPSGNKYILKAKGITQNIAALETCNFDIIKIKAIEKINEIPSEPTIVPQIQFRTNSQHIVTTKDLTKRFEVTSDKRIVKGNDTFPYGYDFSV